jgi:hypothetical protein
MRMPRIAPLFVGPRVLVSAVAFFGHKQDMSSDPWGPTPGGHPGGPPTWPCGPCLHQQAPDLFRARTRYVGTPSPHFRGYPKARGVWGLVPGSSKRWRLGIGRGSWAPHERLRGRRAPPRCRTSGADEGAHGPRNGWSEHVKVASISISLSASTIFVSPSMPPRHWTLYIPPHLGLLNAQVLAASQTKSRHVFLL